MSRLRPIQAVAGFAAIATATAAGCALLAGAVARRVVTPEARPDSSTRVRSVLPAARASRRYGVDGPVVRIRGGWSELPGSYSLILDGGATHAKVGPVLEARRGTAAREILTTDRGRVRRGATGRVTGWWYADPEELADEIGEGASVERIVLPLEDGPATAWIVRPADPVPGRWAVHVHGMGALPAETLRGVPPLARAGLTSLVISYRNDPGAPRGAHGRYGLGSAEQRDVDAAIAEAVRRGATRVTLFGWSMGGTASTLAATRGAHRDAVDGLVLDSPALDWHGLLRHQARRVGIPRPIAALAVRLLEGGRVRGGDPASPGLAALSAPEIGRGLAVPTLIHVSAGDTYVPEDGALDFAARHSDLVVLRRQLVGEHVKLWNVDPEAWEAATERFVRGLPAPAPASDADEDAPRG